MGLFPRLWSAALWMLYLLVHCVTFNSVFSVFNVTFRWRKTPASFNVDDDEKRDGQLGLVAQVSQ